MPKFATQLTKLRRALRDPEGNVWDTDLLIGLWNEVQHEFQIRTSLLEDVRALSVPPRYETSYMHDWEYEFATEPAYRCLRQQQNFYAYSARFEVQERFSLDESDVSDKGQGYTHPFEAFMASSSPQLPRFNFPDNFDTMKGLYYDEEPLSYMRPRDIVQDSSWEIREGDPIGYTRLDEVSNEFVLFPRPSTVVFNDQEGTGMVTSVSGDTTSAEVGTLTLRTGTVVSEVEGIAVDVIEADDNILIIYDIAPQEVNGPADELDYPAFIAKYIRYGVLARAYRVNNDGYIPSLAAYWLERYQVGIQAVNEFKWVRRRDRDYQLRTKTAPARVSRRHPRLPDKYPATYP